MRNKIPTFVIPLFLCLSLAGCSSSAPTPDPSPEPVHEEIELVNDTNITDPLPEDIPGDTSDKIPEAAPEETPEATLEEMPVEDSEGTEQLPVAKPTNTKAIVWLGDSLTQGSLGGNNDNLPNAPYEKLKQLVNVPVEGYGIYGADTHDIFWMYLDEEHYNQETDPDKVYVFWVGSNDWVVDGVPNTDTSKVFEEIDTFIKRDSGIKNYIVIGTTSRYELGDMYITINRDLAAHYGSHYMDVIDIVNKYGYSGDNIHLSQGSYDAIAAAVYEKLKALGYI